MYKLSNYNYYVKNDDRFIYFNGLSSNSFSVSEKEHHFFQREFQDLISFSIVYNSLFQKFYDWGYIIDEEKNELDTIRFRNRQEVFVDRFYRLVINPTVDCNFNCWYCYEKHPQGFMNQETIEKIKKHVKYMIEHEKIRGMLLNWFGGEPLMYFNEVVYPISKYCKEILNENKLLFQCHATTNAYLITPEMIDSFCEIGLNSFQITIDGDEKRHDKIRNEKGKPSFSRIMNNINLICEKIPDAGITLRINYDEQTLKNSDIRKVFEEIPEKYRKNISPNFQRIWQTYKYNKIEENKERLDLQKYARELGFLPRSASNGLQLNKCHKCYVDRYYHAEINYDGKVYRCTARDYTDKYVAGKLMDNGVILWNSEKMEKMYGKATFENKHCLKCKYLPICAGPCVQKMIETPEENFEKICVLNYTEISPESFIIDCHEQKMESLRKFTK